MDWQLVASYFTVKSTDIFYSVRYLYQVQRWESFKYDLRCVEGWWFDHEKNYTFHLLVSYYNRAVKKL